MTSILGLHKGMLFTAKADGKKIWVYCNGIPFYLVEEERGEETPSLFTLFEIWTQENAMRKKRARKYQRTPKILQVNGKFLTAVPFHTLDSAVWEVRDGGTVLGAIPFLDRDPVPADIANLVVTQD